MAEARRVVETRGRPDLVLTDLNLKDGSGLELTQELRKKFGDRFPVLLISGAGEEELLSRAQAAGANELITKPIAQRALFSKLEEVLTAFRS